MGREKMQEKDKKSKINLKINENLLKEIDIFVKKYNTKRSRFIENLLKKYIENNKTD
jgi:metal-responsive CopG/Arc/MetJ family transcriptional regulator